MDKLKQIVSSIRTFNRQASLKHTHTRDCSAPRIDHHLTHLLAIQNYKRDELHHVQTRVSQHVVVDSYARSSQSICDNMERTRDSSREAGPSRNGTKAMEDASCMGQRRRER